MEDLGGREGEEEGENISLRECFSDLVYPDRCASMCVCVRVCACVFVYICMHVMCVFVLQLPAHRVLCFGAHVCACVCHYFFVIF
jgi:hypothetical protein